MHARLLALVGRGRLSAGRPVYTSAGDAKESPAAISPLAPPPRRPAMQGE